MKLGIVGLPNVGKSTLFNAITNAGAESANYPFCTIEPNVGMVAVPDERLQVLTELHKSAKTVPAFIEFVDIAGLVRGASRGEDLVISFYRIFVRLMRLCMWFVVLIVKPLCMWRAASIHCVIWKLLIWN